MDDAKTWRGIDLALAIVAAVIVAYGVLVLGALLLVALKLAFDIVAANTSVIAGRPSRPVPMRRFIISQEDDARRP